MRSTAKYLLTGRLRNNCIRKSILIYVAILSFTCRDRSSTTYFNVENHLDTEVIVSINDLSKEFQISPDSIVTIYEWSPFGSAEDNFFVDGLTPFGTIQVHYNMNILNKDFTQRSEWDYFKINDYLAQYVLVIDSLDLK